MSSNSKKTTITTTTKTKSKTSSAAAADDDVVVDATSNKRTTMTTMCSLLQQQINHSSIQDLSFGDFTQDELNTYLINKKLNNTNKAANQITEANESKVDNNKSDSQQNQHPTCKNREKEEEEETTRSSSEPVNQSINSPPPSEFDIEFGFDLNPSVLLSASNKVVGEKSEHSKPPTSHRSSDATRPASSSISSLSSSLSSSDDSSTSIRDNDNNEYRHRVSKQQQQQQTVTANSSSVKNLRATVDLTTKTESRAAESSLSSSPPISSHSSTYSSSSPPPSSPPHSSTSSYSSSSPFSVPNTTNTSSSKMETVESRKSMENQTVGSISNNNNNNASQNEQRRNKKKKPPNYYQSAEYAAIIKLNGDLAAAEAAAAAAAAAAEENSTTTTSSSNNNHNDTASNTQETAGNISSKSNHYNAITTESSSKSDKQQSDSETSTKSEEPPTTNGDSKSQSVNEAEKAVTEAAKKLDKVDLNNESGSTSSDEQQKTEQATNTPTTTSAPSSKPSPWSSLFKSSAAPATSHQQQTNSSKQNGQKPAPKTPTTSSSSSTNLNGTGTSSSAASVSGDSEQDKTSVANLDVLKNLGTLLKQCELKHSAPALQPRGLSNRNNWCYVNATLQALLACPPFYNLLKTVYTKLKSANSSSLAMQHVPFVAALGRFISEFKVMVRSTSSTSSQSEQVVKNSSKELVIGEPFECEYFYDVLSKSQSHMEFRPGRQEDAQEFLSFLLNRLHEEMVRCLESLNPPKQQTSQTQQTPLDYTKTNGKSNGYGETAAVNGGEIQEDDDWHEVGRKNRAFVTRKPEFKQSPLSDIFCGQFRSALSQPGVKDKDSVSLEPFFTLPLEIQSDSIRTVQQALEHFVQKEELSGFKHQETKQEIEAFKRISFEDLPPVLIIYLKCFVFDKHGGSQKLLKRLEFAIDLEISRELISPAQRSKLKDKKRSSYKLFAVEYHHGERATGGHYITDVYHPGIVAWVRYDDAHVRVLNNAQVLKSDDRKLIPYLLYYRRCDLI